MVTVGAPRKPQLMTMPSSGRSSNVTRRTGPWSPMAWVAINVAV